MPISTNAFLFYFLFLIKETQNLIFPTSCEIIIIIYVFIFYLNKPYNEMSLTKEIYFNILM